MLPSLCLIVLTMNYGGAPVTVDAYKLAYMHADEDRTYVRFGASTELYVTETPEQVVERIERQCQVAGAGE
jgi:hypothetical protein